MDPRINVISLIVADLDASRAFYVDGLGWPPAMEVPGEVVMFHVGDKLVLSLWDEAHAAEEIGPVARGGTAPMTVAHNCASPTEVDEALADARAAGAQVIGPLKRSWGGYSGYFLDPDGVRWEIAHNPFPIGGVTLP